MDKDFGELVYHSGQKHAGVLISRIEYARRSEKIRVVKYILSNYAHQLQGSFSGYQHVPPYLDTLALTYYQKGMYVEAEDAIKKALKLKPGDETYP